MTRAPNLRERLGFLQKHCATSLPNIIIASRVNLKSPPNYGLLLCTQRSVQRKQPRAADGENGVLRSSRVTFAPSAATSTCGTFSSPDGVAAYTHLCLPRDWKAFPGRQFYHLGAGINPRSQFSNSLIKITHHHHKPLCRVSALVLLPCRHSPL